MGILSFLLEMACIHIILTPKLPLQMTRKLPVFSDGISPPPQRGGGTPLFGIYRYSMCSPKGAKGFSAVVVINKLLILAIFVTDRVQFLHD